MHKASPVRNAETGKAHFVASMPTFHVRQLPFREHAFKVVNR